jgi:hypothetical protein
MDLNKKRGVVKWRDIVKTVMNAGFHKSGELTGQQIICQPLKDSGSWSLLVS